MADSAPRRRWRVGRLLAGVLVALIAFVVISDLLGWRYLRQPAQHLLSSLTHRQVTIGEPFRLHLRANLHGQIGELTVGAPDWSDEPHFVSLTGLRATIGWGVLFGRPPHVRSLSLDSGDIRALRRADGRSSWTFDENAAAPSADRPAPALPRIDRLELGGLRVRYVDEPLNTRIDAQASTGAREDGAVGLNASGKGSWQRHPFEFELGIPRILEAASLQQPAALTSRVRLKTSELRFDGTIADVPTFDGIAGKVVLSGQSLGDLALVPGVTLPETPPFKLQGSVARNGGDITIDVPTFEVGSSRMYADLRYHSAQQPPLLSGRLGASRFVLQDLGPSIGTEGGRQQPAGRPEAQRTNAVKDGKGTQGTRQARGARQARGTGGPAKGTDETKVAKGAEGSKEAKGSRETGETRAKPTRVLPTREFDIPSLKAMNADVALDFKELDLGTDALRPLRALSAKLTLNGGVLELSDLNGALAGGRVTGSTRYDGATDPRAPAWTARLNWNRVDLGEWVNNQGRNLFVAGRFSGDTRFTSTGRSTAALLDGLDGSVKGRIDDGAISHLVVEAMGLDVAQALGVFVAGPQPLKLSCALVDLKSTRGKVTSSALLNTVDSMVFVDGRVNFRDEGLDLRLVSAPKDWSPLTLRTPVTVRGTFGDPDVSVEPRPLAMRLIASVVLGTVVAPVAAILPLIDLGDGGSKDDGCAAAVQAAREHASRGNGPAPVERR